MWRIRRNTNDRDVLSLVIHGPKFHNGELLVLNPDIFPDIKLHDLVEIVQLGRIHPRLVLAVESLAPVRGKVQVSIARDIAIQFGLEPFRSITVRRVEQKDVAVDFVELSFKDQFLSRADIWRFKVTMLGQCVYVGRTVEYLGIRGQVDAILSSNIQLHCGVIGDATKIVVRSRSSRLFWLVQMSTEMWEFAPDGQVYYEKLLNRLIHALINKWIESSVSHSVTIIVFSRSFYDADQFPDGYEPRQPLFSDPQRQGFSPGCSVPGINMAHGYGPTIHVDPLSGRYYEDFYKVVVMNFTGPDWSRLLLLLKKEFASYYKVHRWRTPEVFSPARYEICRFPTQKSEVGKTSTTAAEGYENSEELYVKWLTLPAGVPSRAKDGNILEAINVTLNVLDKHYMDRDLSRTGQGIVMMTAGCSVFNVNSKLAKITEQRMMDSGVGMDMISLSTPPLHVVPLFIYCNQPPSKVSSTNSEVPSFLQKRFFGDVLGEEAKPLEGVTSFNDIPIMISIFQPRSPEWVRAGSDVLRRPPTPVTFNDTGIMAGLSESKEKMVYDVPHWVNIAFLDFDCSCERGSSNFSRSSPSTTSISNQQKQNGQHEGRVWHSYGCQFKRNKQFNPLPSFRMFDITAPSEKLVFPVMLQNLMRKDSTKLSSCDLNAIPTCVDHNENGSIYDFESGGVCVAAGAPLSIEVNESQNQLLFKTSELPSLASPAHPPEQLQLSRSPDFDPILASKGFPTNLNASWRVRAALKAYDESVFLPVVRDSESVAGRSLYDRRLSFVPLEIHREDDDATSATIASDGHLEWFLRNVKKEAACMRKRSHSSSNGRLLKENLFLTSESTSMAQTLISPRKIKLPHNRLKLDQTDRTIVTASCLIPKASVNPSISHEVTLSGSMERRGYQSLSGAPGKNRSDSFRPLVRTTMNKELSLTSGNLPVYTSPPRKDGFISKLTSSQHHCSNPGTPIGLRRNQSEVLRAQLAPAVLSYKNVLATDLMLTPIDRRKAAVNPFQYTKAQCSQGLSSDRQRWSHLFPASNQYSQRTSNDFPSELAMEDGEPIFVGPNWTSLTSPAILPLTTDHFPSPHELRQGYSEAFYTLTIPTTAQQTPAIECVPRYRNHNELLIEMICQRLARGFQLVSTCDSTSSLMNREISPGSRRRVYHLSMGHRIHQLIYDAERQTVEVKRFVQREPHDSKVASISYNYSLWVELTQSFQPHQQIFHRYPQPEDNWNALDNLLCGYLDDMADTMKCRRVRFAIVPPVLATSSIGDNNSPTAYATKFTKFIEFLQSRVAPSEFGELENIMINMVLEDVQKTGEPPLLIENRMLSFKMACKASSISLSSASKLEDARTEWVVMRLEETMDISRCFHLDVRWLACSGIGADEFVGTVRRRAKQSGLDLRRVPEYFSVSRVQIHPLIPSVFLPLPVQILKFFVSTLVQTLDFVLDDERIADGSGIGYGLGIEEKKLSVAKPKVSIGGQRRSPSTNARLLLDHWQQRGYKQLIHRSLPVSVRMIHNGLVWIPGYDDDRKVDRATSLAATDALFREVCATIKSQCGH